MLTDWPNGVESSVVVVAKKKRFILLPSTFTVLNRAEQNSEVGMISHQLKIYLSNSIVELAKEKKPL